MTRSHAHHALRIAGLSSAKRVLLNARLADRTVDGYGLIAETLSEHRVNIVFGVSGTPMRRALAACVSVGVRVIGVHDQQAAVLMAAAHNYAVGRMAAVAVVSAGPAITNATTGVLVARDNAWPVVVLGGRRALGNAGRGSFQELDGATLMCSISKWSAVLASTDDLSAGLAFALRMAMDGRPGPVYLDLTEECLQGRTRRRQAEVDPLPISCLKPAVSQGCRSAAEILCNAKRPALLIGKGVRWADAFEVLTSLVDEFRIPFITSPMGRGLLSDQHPSCFNHAASDLQSTADAVLLVGGRLDWTFRFGSTLARQVRLIQIDIDGSELGRNRVVEVGIEGDAREVLEAILAHMRERTAGCETRLPEPAWIAELEHHRSRRRTRLEALGADDSEPMSPYRMMRDIRDSLPEGAVTILDGNVSMAIAQEVIPSQTPLTRLTAGSNGCMGTGIPFAIGCKLAMPSRSVIAICGDFAIGLAVLELETAIRHGVPVVVVVANNRGLGGHTVQRELYPPNSEWITRFGDNVRYDRMAEALGAHGELVTSPTQIHGAMTRALSAEVAACIDVRIDPDTKPGP